MTAAESARSFLLSLLAFAAPAAITAHGAPASAESAASTMYIYSAGGLDKGCEMKKEENFKKILAGYLPEEERFYFEFVMSAVNEDEMTEEQREQYESTGKDIYQNAFWVVTSPGGNPKRHYEEYAIIYADMAKNRISVYAYDGVNSADSYRQMDYLATFEDALVTEDLGGMMKVSAYLDVADVNAAKDSDKWQGIGFGEEAGLWFHTSFDTDIGYAEAQEGAGGGYKTGDTKGEMITVTGAGGMLAKGTVTYKVTEYDYSAQGAYKDTGNEKTQKIEVIIDESVSEEESYKEIQKILDEAGFSAVPQGEGGTLKPLSGEDRDAAANRRKQFSWCTFFDDLAALPDIGASEVHGVAIEGTDFGFTDVNVVETGCLGDIKVYIGTSRKVEEIIAARDNQEVAMEIIDDNSYTDRRVFMLSNTASANKQFFTYGSNNFTVSLRLADGRTSHLQRELIIPRP